MDVGLPQYFRGLPLAELLPAAGPSDEGPAAPPRIPGTRPTRTASWPLSEPPANPGNLFYFHAGQVRQQLEEDIKLARCTWSQATSGAR